MTRTVCLGIVLAILAVIPAQAQYGDGNTGGGTGGASSTTGGYGGGGGKTAALIGAYAAAGTGLYIYLLKRSTNMVGCVSQTPQGLQITNEKDNKSYALESESVSLEPGRRVEIRGRKSKYGDEHKFRTKKLVKDFGPCEISEAR